MQQRINIVLVGDACVGKTAAALWLVKGAYTFAPPTVANDTFEIKMNVKGMKMDVSIWDTAGQESYKSIPRFYYNYASIFIIFFALGNPSNIQKFNPVSTFESVTNWYNEVSSSNDQAIIALCGNMCDIPNEQRSVSTADANDKAAELGIQYFETSSLDGTGIKRMFQTLTEQVIDNRRQKLHQNIEIQIEQVVPEKESKKCC
ncbi:small GTP-binding protein [Histomonas meleagridis]|uniref:small GTP-binding protein n=1 Tax=Histomonas meleagridis TaxID=135588 RepID=UPI003559FB78|nr:small GTP-binding protein [Histomonas meleagridis]